MKLKFFALALLAASITQASAAETWQGEAVVLHVAGSNCGSDVEVGNFYRSAYSPKGMSNNGPYNSLSFVGPRNAFTHRFYATAPNTPFAGMKISSRGPFNAFNGRFLSFARAPANLAAASPTVVIVAKISNWEASGCTATIRGAYVKRQ